MFNPLENEAAEAWFKRLNAPLKRLPAEERAELHQEVRQHLESLAKANEELGSSPEEAWEHALTQFGDPGKFGRQMQREARALARDPNQWSKNPLKAAALFAFVSSAFCAAWAALISLLTLTAVTLFTPTDSLDAVGNNVFNSAFVTAGYGISVGIGLAIGLSMKQKAAPGTLCGLLPLWTLGCAAALGSHDNLLAVTLLLSLGAGTLTAWAGAKMRPIVPARWTRGTRA